MTRMSKLGFGSPVYGALVLSEVDEGDGEARKVRDVVVEQLGRFVHLVVEASVPDLDQERIGRMEEEAEVDEEEEV